MYYQKKNILYVGGFELPDKNAAAHRVSMIGKMLEEDGNSVYYLGVSRSNPLGCYYNNNTWLIGYPKKMNDWINYTTSIKNIKELVENHLYNKIDIIIAYNYPSIALFKLNRYCRRKNILLVADCTEWSTYSDRFLFRFIKLFDSFFRMRFVHKSLDGIIVISRFLFNYYSPQMQHVLLIPPLVDKNNFKWTNPSRSNKHSPIRLIYAGFPGSGEKDQIDLIINSLSKTETSTPFQLVLVGINKEEYFKKFGVNSIPLNIIDNVIFIGKLSHLATIELIKNSTYFIFFRKNKRNTAAGFPTKLIESITCGVPVITNSTSDIEEYFINNNIGFLLDYKKEKDLISSLSEIIDLPINELEQKKQQYFSSNYFHYETHKKKLNLFIKKLLLNQNHSSKAIS